jgi:hypothetical protein
VSYTDSAPVSATLTLQGVWVHDPDDPGGTAYNLPYGKAARSGSLEVAEQENTYAGREFPVVDFGEFTAERYDVRVDVPFGPTHGADVAALKGFIRARKLIVFRDNRGRVVAPAKLSGFREQDMETGTQLSVQVSRMDG